MGSYDHRLYAFLKGKTIISITLEINSYRIIRSEGNNEAFVSSIQMVLLFSFLFLNMLMVLDGPVIYTLWYTGSLICLFLVFLDIADTLSNVYKTPNYNYINLFGVDK